MNTFGFVGQAVSSPPVGKEAPGGSGMIHVNDWAEIRRLHGMGMKVADIARRVGVARGTVYAALAREGGPGYEGFEVWFTFASRRELKQEWARDALAREYPFQLAAGWHPGPQYLGKYKVRVGRRYPRTLKVITEGTCKPVVFEFTGLKRDDYFESSGVRR